MLIVHRMTLIFEGYSEISISMVKSLKFNNVHSCNMLSEGAKHIEILGILKFKCIEDSNENNATKASNSEYWILLHIIFLKACIILHLLESSPSDTDYFGE